MLDELQELLDGTLHIDLPTRLLFCRDGSTGRQVPSGVFRPASKADLRKLVPLASARQIPLSVRGGGTGKSGGCLTGGLVVDLGATLNRVTYDPETKSVEVDAGATVAAIEQILNPMGRTLGFPPEWRPRSVGGIFASTSPDYTPGPWRDLFQSLLSGNFLFSEGMVLNFGNAAGANQCLEDAPESWSQRIAMMESASREWVKNRKVWPGLPGPRFNPVVKKQTEKGAVVLAGGLGRTGVLLDARLETLELDRHFSAGLVAFGDLVSALDFLANAVREHGVAATLFERRQVRSALQFFREPWLDWADEAGEWVALLGAPPGVFSDWHFLKSVPSQRRWEAAGESFHSRVRFVMESGLVRGADVLSRANIGDLFVPIADLEKALDQIREDLSRSRLVATLMVHVERGQIEIFPLGSGNEQKPEIPAEKVLDSVGMRVAQSILAMGGSIGLEFGLGRTRRNWWKLLPPQWLQYQEDLQKILDPCAVFETSEGDTPGETVPPQQDSIPLDQVADLSSLSGCYGCGQCRGTDLSQRICPGFSATGLEEATPRAKAMLAEAFARGELEPEQSLGEKVQQVASWCVQCRMCDQGCPAGLKVPEWSQKLAEAQFVAEGGSWSGWLLAQADRLGPWLSQVAPFVNRLLRFGPVRWGLEKWTGLAKERDIPAFTKRPFLELSRKKGWDHPPVSPRMRAAVFVDYFANYHRPEIAESLVKILHHNRIEAHVPKNQGSSGFAAMVVGDRETALEQAKTNLRVFADLAREGFPIICTEPTAALFLRKDLPRLIPGEESRLVASQVVEATSFLLDLLDQGLMRTDFQMLSIAVDHHVPCHVKALGRRPAGPEILKLIPGAGVRVLDVSCSGMAGLWGMEKPNLASSLQIGKPMLSKWREGKASLGSSECSSCRMQMLHGDSRPVFHPLEIIAAAYGYPPRDFPGLMQAGKRR